MPYNDALRRAFLAGAPRRGYRQHVIRNKRRSAAALLAALATAAVVGTASAQNPPRNQAEYDAMLRKQREAFYQKIGLSAKQKSKITSIEKKYKPQVDGITKKYEPKAKRLQDQMIALQKQMAALQQQYQAEVRPVAQKMDKEFEAVLTPAQRTKVKEMQAQARKQQGGGAPRG